MNEILNDIFGKGRDLTTLQVGLRAAAMFLVALIMIRVGGKRILGRKTPFDTIVAIMMGAILSRGVVGVSPFGHTVVAVAVMIAIHRLISVLCIYNQHFAWLVMGGPLVLYDKGELNQKNMKRCSLSRNDLLQSLRHNTHHATLDKIEKAFMENDGHISFIIKKEDAG